MSINLIFDIYVDGFECPITSITIIIQSLNVLSLPITIILQCLNVLSFSITISLQWSCFFSFSDAIMFNIRTSFRYLSPFFSPCLNVLSLLITFIFHCLNVLSIASILQLDVSFRPLTPGRRLVQTVSLVTAAHSKFGYICPSMVRRSMLRNRPEDIPQSVFDVRNRDFFV